MNLRKLHVLAACLLRTAHGQSSSSAAPTPYQSLPPAAPWLTGTFLTPNTVGSQIFSEGSQMNISWTTNFTAINLYFAGNNTLDAHWQITLATGLSQRWFTWPLQCLNHNCDVAYQFAAATTYGNTNAQLHNGFQSGEFWIRPTQSLPASSSSTTTSRSSAPPSSQTTGSKTRPTAPSTVTVTPTATGAPAHSSNNSTAIGVGVGVGVGAAIIIVLACVWYWRYRHRREADPVRPTTEDQMCGSYAPPSEYYHPPSEVYAHEAKTPQEAPGTDAANELPGS